MTRFVILAALIAVLACPAWADPKVDPSELPPVERIDSSVQAIRGQLKNVQSKLRHGVGDLSKPADGSLVKSRQKPVGGILTRCCSMNLEKIAYRGAIVGATIEELTSRFKREGNAKGLTATQALSRAMKNLDDAVQGVGVTGDSSFALKEMSKVRIAFDQIDQALAALKECCPDPE